MSLPAVGSNAPEFTLTDLDGQERSLRSLLDSGPVGLFFFKSGCGATDLAAPAAELIWQGYCEHVSAEGTRFQIVGLSQDDEAEAGRSRDRLGLTFPILVDAALGVSRLYDLEVTPTFFILRGAERLRADARGLPAAADYRIVDLVEGWSREAYGLAAEEVAARVGALPVELPAIAAATAHRPG